MDDAEEKETVDEQNNHYFCFEEMPEKYQDEIITSVLLALSSSLRNKGVLMKFLSCKTNPKLIEDMKVRDMVSLLNLPGVRENNLVSVSLNLEALNPYLKKLEKEDQERTNIANNIYWMLINGATKKMILDTFPVVNPEELALWTKIVFRDKSRKQPTIGRSKVISNEKVITKLLDEWYRLQKENISNIDKLRALKEQFPEHSLAVLKATIDSNDK